MCLAIPLRTKAPITVPVVDCTCDWHQKVKVYFNQCIFKKECKHGFIQNLLTEH